MSFATPNPDYTTVPASLRHLVCDCGYGSARGGRGFTNPINFPPAGTFEFTDKQRALYKLNFNWWVCGVCMKPAPLNALNARLIRECEMCEDPYFITHYPDRMDLCPLCA